MKINKAAATLGRKGGAVKSERKTAAVRENGKKSRGPWQWWTTGDTPESCIPLGHDPDSHGLPDTVTIVRARSAREAWEKAD